MPSVYLLIRAARYLGVSPWELAKRPVYWRDWALLCEKAEQEAQEAPNLTTTETFNFTT